MLLPPPSHPWRALGASLLLVLTALAPAVAAQPAMPSAQEAWQHWRERLQGRHFTATLRQLEAGKGYSRLTIRRDEAEGRERVLVRIEQPRINAGESWLMLEESEGDTLYAYSAADREPNVRKITSLRARDPFSGADPSLFGLRAGTWPTQPESIERTELEGRPALLLSERALGPEPPFRERRVWLDPETWMALRLEQRDDSGALLTGQVTEHAEVQGVATPRELRFERDDGVAVEFRIETMDYQRPIRESYFELPR